MRNLCGLKITEDKKLQKAIGEFDFWQEALGNSNGMIIPLYNENLSKLTKEEDAILRQLFSLKFPNVQPPSNLNASMILGPDFSDFTLIDVPGDGNCGITSVLVAGGEMSQKFGTDSNGCLVLDEVQREQMIQLRQNASECVPLLHPRGVEIANRLQSIDCWLGGEDFAFIAQAIQRPIVLIQPVSAGDCVYAMINYSVDGNENPLKNKTLSQILKEAPNTIFIYYNGINHFQALVLKKHTSCIIQ